MADDNDRLVPGGSSALGVRSKPTSPASEAVVLYDSRSWDGSTIGVGTGGLPNEGTATSVPDLDVFVQHGSNRTETRATNGVGVFQEGITWEDLGGDPCEQPFTLYVAWNQMDPGYPGATGEFGMQLRETQFGFTRTLVSAFASTFGEDDVSGSVAMRIVDVQGDMPQTLYRMGVNPGQGANIRNMLHVYTMDPIDGGGSCWRDGVPIEPLYETFGSSSEEYYSVIDTGYPNDAFGNPGGCTQAPADISTWWWDISFGQDRRVGDGTSSPLFGAPAAGERWNGIFGVALCRGEPTAADIAYWDDYFYGVGYTPWVNPVKYDVGESTYGDATHVYHDLRFPGNQTINLEWNATKPPTIDALLVGGGAGGGGNETAPAGHEGGGGGQVIELTAIPAPDDGTVVTIGDGGLGGQPGVQLTQPGEDTVGFGSTAFGGGVGAGGTGGFSGSGNAGGAGDGTRGGGGGGNNGTGGVPSANPPPDGTAAGGGVGALLSGWAQPLDLSKFFGNGGQGGGPAGTLPAASGIGPVWPNNGGTNSGSGGSGARTDGTDPGSDGGSGRIVIRYAK